MVLAQNVRRSGAYVGVHVSDGSRNVGCAIRAKGLRSSRNPAVTQGSIAATSSVRKAAVSTEMSRGTGVANVRMAVLAMIRLLLNRYYRTRHRKLNSPWNGVQTNHGRADGHRRRNGVLRDPESTSDPRRDFPGRRPRSLHVGSRSRLTLSDAQAIRCGPSSYVREALVSVRSEWR